METSKETVQHRGLTTALAVLLLLVFFARGAAAIPRLSLTADEPAFVGPGLAYLQTGDLRLETQAAHPPLLFVLTAAPLLLQPVPDVTALPGWAEADLATFSRAFVDAIANSLPAATFAARLPVLLMALVGAGLVFRWAADYSGAWAGLAALALFTLDPNVLAHATLATTDVGLAVFGFAAAYLMLRLLRRRSAGLYVAAGVALGLTLGAKSSGAFAAVMLPAVYGVARGFRRDGPPGRLYTCFAEAAGLAGLASLVLWALYGFEVRPVAGLGGLPLPFATQWETWLGVRTHAQEGHTAFLMGEISARGWLAYYPLAFVLKTPLPLLALLGAAAARFLRAGPRRWAAEMPAWLYPAAYAGVTLFGTIAIGYRFLLVVLPFSAVFAARWVPRRGWGKWGWAALLVWLFAGTVWVHPHYLAYFNELAGGPLGGQRYLVDSNLDWGQSFVALREALDERNIDTLRLSYYTYADPAHYGIRYEPIAPARGAPATLPARFNPAPGVYVIGATPLQGVMVADPSTYDWFRHRPPDARPGFALFFYDVEEPQQPPTWLAQCTVPVVPLPPDAIAEGFGRDDLRLATFDCTQSWLFPTGGAEAGWYALFRDTAQSDSPFVQSHLVLARLSFEQTRSGALPPFAIYEAGGVPVPAHAFTETVAVGELRLLGYTLASSRVRAGETVEVWTYWRVEGLLQRLPSLMLHLIGADGVPLAVGDGLGVPVESWRVGDVFVQRHALAVPAGAPVGEATLVTGAYWLDSLERWAVHVGGEVGGDQFVLGTITFPEASSELPGR